MFYHGMAQQIPHRLSIWKQVYSFGQRECDNIYIYVQFSWLKEISLSIDYYLPQAASRLASFSLNFFIQRSNFLLARFCKPKYYGAYYALCIF